MKNAISTEACLKVHILPREETIVALTSMLLYEGQKQNTESARYRY